jgi:uncharacterized membrane protein
MMIGMVGIWALLIWGAIYVVTQVTNRPSAPQQGSALEILEERFARGEIDGDELETRRTALQGN